MGNDGCGFAPEATTAVAPARGRFVAGGWVCRDPQHPLYRGGDVQLAEIHRAYNFNLWELPWTLCVLGLLGWLVGLVWRDLRWLAGALLFLAADLFVLRIILRMEPTDMWCGMCASPRRN